LRPAYSLRETAVFTRRRRVKVEFLSYILFSVAVTVAVWHWQLQQVHSFVITMYALLALAATASATNLDSLVVSESFVNGE
jgi:hypothetical protein